MQCERCQGGGLLTFMASEFGLEQRPCPDCGGDGIAYCCDEAGINPPNTYDPLEWAVMSAP